MSKKLNPNVDRRNSIIWISPGEDRGGLSHFDDLSIDGLETLIEENFVDPSDRQNEAPSIAEFLSWAKDVLSKHPYLNEQISFTGYAVSRRRRDYRVSIEGITIDDNPEKVPSSVVAAFAKKFKNADELSVDPGGQCKCWYD